MGEALAVRDAYRAQEWAMLIRECSASGLTKREFCQQRGISEKSFYYWLKKLRTHMVEAAVPQLVQLESLPAKDSILLLCIFVAVLVAGTLYIWFEKSNPVVVYDQVSVSEEIKINEKEIPSCDASGNIS